MTDSRQLKSLAKRLLITQTVCVLLFAVLGYFVVVEHRSGQIDISNTHVSGSGVQVGPHDLGRLGMTVRANDDQRSNAVLKAQPGSAWMAVGTEGRGLALAAKVGSSSLTLSATGRVSSELQIDTETGAWTVVRWVEPRTSAREARTELVRPIVEDFRGP